MVVYDELKMDTQRGHAGVSRHRCKRHLTEQDRARDTERRGMGAVPRAGYAHAAMFQLKTPRRGKILN